MKESGWVSRTEQFPPQFVSVLGAMDDAEPFPPVRECYMVGLTWYFPALDECHPVSWWRPMPEPPKGENNG